MDCQDGVLLLEELMEDDYSVFLHSLVCLVYVLYYSLVFSIAFVSLHSICIAHNIRISPNHRACILTSPYYTHYRYTQFQLYKCFLHLFSCLPFLLLSSLFPHPLILTLILILPS